MLGEYAYSGRCVSLAYISQFHFSDLSEHVNRVRVKVSNTDGGPTIMTSGVLGRCFLSARTH